MFTLITFFSSPMFAIQLSELAQTNKLWRVCDGHVARLVSWWIRVHVKTSEFKCVTNLKAFSFSPLIPIIQLRLAIAAIDIKLQCSS